MYILLYINYIYIKLQKTKEWKEKWEKKRKMRKHSISQYTKNSLYLNSTHIIQLD